MKKALFILAPMDDVTDTVFRRIVSECAAPDLTMTEFVNVDGLCSAGRERVLPKLSSVQDATPAIAQIWGKRPENFEQIAREIAKGDINGYTAIDINFGCPDKAVVKNECCSAMQQPELWDKALAIIRATIKGAGDTPVSLKTRLGFREIDYRWHELLLKEQPSMLTVHARTTKQMSKVPAQWEAITPIIELRKKLSPETKIVLNGDVRDRDHGLELAKMYGVDGIMIGRGVFKNPYCFADNAEQVWAEQGRKERIALFRKHIELFAETYTSGERKYNPLKKFAKIYISDFAGSAELRQQIMETTSLAEAQKLLRDIS